MDSNPIARSWSRLLEIARSFSRASRADDRLPDDFVAKNSTYDDEYDETRVTPYSPESQRVRSESSLHLSC